MTRGDSRISVTIAKNEFTSKLSRNNRFIIDDPDSSIKLAYLLTKPLKLGWTYNQSGVFCFVLQEVVTTDYDNLELGIADYYKHFQRPEFDKPEGYSNPSPERAVDENGRQVWL